MNRALVVVGVLLMMLAFLAPSTPAKVINENTDNLPPGCDEIAGDESITIKGGRDQAREFPGTVFTFDQRSFDYPPCTRLTVTFVNEDDIRHQFMVHGVHPEGMFTIEVTGPGEDTGTFILNGDQRTLMFHCGVPQHQQKGMKGQFLVDGGVGDLPNIPGISGLPPEDRGAPAGQESAPAMAVGWALLGVVALAGLAHGRRP